MATTTAGQSTYAYDANGWRAAKVEAGATTYFLRGGHGELLSEVQNPGTSSVTQLRRQNLALL